MTSPGSDPDGTGTRAVDSADGTGGGNESQIGLDRTLADSDGIGDETRSALDRNSTWSAVTGPLTDPGTTRSEQAASLDAFEDATDADAPPDREIGPFVRNRIGHHPWPPNVAEYGSDPAELRLSAALSTASPRLTPMTADAEPLRDELPDDRDRLLDSLVRVDASDEGGSSLAAGERLRGTGDWGVEEFDTDLDASAIVG